MQNSSLMQPPYASDLQVQGGSLWFYFGSAEAWRRVQAMRDAGWNNGFLLPPGRMPEEYDWSCVAGRPVMVIELATTSKTLRQRLMLALASYGASEAFLIPKPYRVDDVLFWNCGPRAGRVSHVQH